MPFYNEIDLLNVGGVDNDVRDSYTRAMIAGEEKETYSTHTYDVNQFFIWNDRNLYKVKAAISIGDTFVLNTNIELAGKISDQLYQLFANSSASLKGIISNVENSANASRNFAIGEQFIWTDGYLYKVKVTTTLGTAWTVDTNCELADNITEQLRNIQPVLNLADLNDVDIDLLTLEDGQALVYNNLTGKYENRDIGGSVGELVTVPAGNPLVFETESEQVASNSVITFEPIQAGSGDPSPSNVRAISGYDSAEINISDSSYVTGYTIESGGINGTSSSIEKSESDNRIRLFWIPVNNGDEIVPYITCDRAINISAVVYSSNEFGTNTQLQSFGWSTNGKAFKITANGYLLMSIKAIDNLAISTSEINVSIMKSSINTSIPFPSTVYIGTLDVESGKLVITHKHHKITSSDNWGYSSGRGYVVKHDLKKLSDYTNAIICDKLVTITNATAVATTDLSITGYYDANNSYPNQNWIYLKNSECTSSAEYKTWVDSIGGIDVVYELATPITYHLTPRQISLLKGSNTVVTNGTTITLTYREGEVASLEDVGNVAKAVNDIPRVSNPNLLDNPWFTINQRKFNIHSAVGDYYTVDRWIFRTATSENTITKVNAGLQMTQGGSTKGRIFQKSEDWTDSLNGKTVTGSVLLDDGTIYTGTAYNIDTSDPAFFVQNDDIRIFLFQTGSGASQKYAFCVEPQKNMTIKAVKLELGSTSTLAMDVAPNYTEELAKCKYYFRRIWDTNGNIAVCFGLNATKARIYSLWQEPMRSGSNTVLFTGTISLIDSGGTSHAVSNISVSPTGEITFTSTSLSQNATYTVLATNSVLDVSADL